MSNADDESAEMTALREYCQHVDDDRDELRARVATLTEALDIITRACVAGAYVGRTSPAVTQAQAALTGATPTPAADAREPRGCPTPGACSCVAPDREALAAIAHRAFATACNWPKKTRDLGADLPPSLPGPWLAIADAVLAALRPGGAG